MTEIFDDVVKRFEGQSFLRVVAFGASNTERYMSGCHWTDVVEVGLRTRFGRRFHLINAGVSGNTTREALARFDRDVAFYKPDLVIITLGGNDCCADPKRHVDAPEYRDNLKKIAELVRGWGGIPVFQTYYKMDLDNMAPERARGFVDNMEIVRQVASETGTHLVDQYALFDKADLLVLRYKLLLNPMHVNEAGNMLIGVHLLDHLGIDPFSTPHVSGMLANAALLYRELQAAEK